MEAKIFFGDIEITKTKVEEIKNPYSGKMVSSFPVCNASDATLVTSGVPRMYRSVSLHAS